MSYCISFPPIESPQARILILGSMPGIHSLTVQEYYAHPQNSFWKIMHVIYEMPVDTYAQRQKLIVKNNIVLWDTLKACVRQGSLDSSIKTDTIEVNDFAKLFKKHPAITHVFFNGGTAESVFKKHVQLPENIQRRLTFTRLPSTSPAHAGMTFKEKLKAWQAIKPRPD